MVTPRTRLFIFSMLACYPSALMSTADEYIPIEPCPDGGVCTKNPRETIIYFGCTDQSEFEELPQGIPSGVTHISCKAGNLRRITQQTLSSFHDLSILMLQYNKIDYIDKKAFSNNKKLKRIYLSHNKVRKFPWSSLLWLNVEALMLEFNNIIDPPHRISVLYRINRMGLFNISSNPFQCSCSLQNFANWITERNETMRCRSALNWIRLTTRQISEDLLTDCQKPGVEMFIETNSQALRNSFDQMTSRVGNGFTGVYEIESDSAQIDIDKGENATVKCRLSSASASNDVIIRIGWKNVRQGFNLKEKTSPDDIEWEETDEKLLYSPSTTDAREFFCAAENLAGTFIRSVLFNVIPGRSDVSHDASLETPDYENENESHSYNHNNTSDILKPLCEAPTIILERPIKLSPVTYRKKLSKEVQVQIQEKKQHRTIEVHVTGTGETNDFVRLCHTHGPRMLTRWVHLSPPQDNVIIKTQSAIAPDFLVCVELRYYHKKICGNFTVTPLPQENALVILVVGGLMLGIGIIPLAVAFLYQPYRKESKKTHYRNYLKSSSGPFLANDAKHKQSALSNRRSTEIMSLGEETNNFLQVPHEGTPMQMYEDIVRSSIDSRMGNFGVGLELESQSDLKRSNSVKLWLNRNNVEEWSFNGDYSNEGF